MGKRNLKAELQEDLKTNYENRDSGGMQGAQYLDMRGDDRSFIKLKKGKNAIDIIPFVRGTDLFKGKSKDSLGTMLDIYVHKYFNQNYDKCVCMKRTFGKACPICEERSILKDMEEPDTKEERIKLEKRIKSLTAKQRVISCAINLKEDEDDENNGQIQVLDESYYLFAKPLLEEACADEDGGPVNYAYPDGGKEIHIRAVEEKIGTAKYLEFSRFDFEDRDEEYDEDIVDYDYEDDVLEHGAFSLDSLLVIPTYEEVQAMLDEGAIAPEKEEDEEEDKAPTPKKKRKGKKVVKPESVEEDPEEDKPVEEETPENECPHGHEFGADNMEKDECKLCKKKTPDIFRGCVMAEYDN